MEMADEAGYFAALIPGKGVTDYVYRVEYPEGKTEEIIDPYRFGPVITKKDTDLFAAGTHYEAYKILGAHSCCIDGVKGVHFAVWAPNAVMGERGRRFLELLTAGTHQMRRLWDSGIFGDFHPGGSGRTEL